MKNGLLILILTSLVVGCKPPPVAPRPQLPLPEEYLESPFPPGKYGSRLINNDAGEPSTFNPLIVEDAASGGMISQLQDSLLHWNPFEEKFIPGLAKSWEVGADSKTFTFHLRKGLQWSDGAPLTAQDVEFSFRCYYDKRFPNRKAFDLSVDGKPFEVKALDDYTIRVVTPDIFAPCLLYLSGADILPKHILEKSFIDGSLLRQWSISTAMNEPEKLVSSGMFVLHVYKPGERIIFRANPYYYQADSLKQRLPYIDWNITRFVKDSNASIAAFAAGLTDFESITPDQVEWVRRGEKTYDYKILDLGPSTTSSFVWFNQNPGKDANGKPFVLPYKWKWFTNQKFRQAISYGIDRQGLVDGVLFGRGAPLWGPESPANRKWFNPHVKQYPYSPTESLKLLAEEGFQKGADGLLRDSEKNLVEFNIITNDENPIRKNMATAFVENMKELGITVKLQFEDFGSFVKKIAESYNYEAGLLGFTGGGDPVGGMSIYCSTGRLHQWYPNQTKPATAWEAKIDELMTKQLKTLDEKKRYEYYAEVQAIMAEQMPLIYLVTPKTYYGMKTRWQNISLPLPVLRFGISKPSGPKNSMIWYIIRRLTTLLWLLPAITFLAFVLMKLAPGDYLDQLKMQRDIKPEMIEQKKKDLGLDKPWVVQYGLWVKKVVTLDFDESFHYRVPVLELIAARAPATITLSLTSLAFAWMFALPLGVLAAVYKDSIFDRILAGFAYVSLSLPEFFLALLAVWFAANSGGWFPIGGRTAIDHEFMSPTGQFWDYVYHLILPVFVMGIGGIGSLSRVMRANVLDVLRSEYVTAARAKGLSEGVVLFRYVFRNAINPFLSTIGYAISGLLSGSLLIENIMNYPGLGQLIYKAFLQKDQYVVLGSLVIGSALLIIGNLISDILLALYDPRIRHEK